MIEQVGPLVWVAALVGGMLTGLLIVIAIQLEFRFRL